jgi:phenylacetic acid degradation operon negative regulatory protein
MGDAPTLSLFYKILLFVEDKENVSLPTIMSFGSTRQTLGALGRLEGLNYIERTKSPDGDMFTLTDSGDNVIADMIERIPHSEHVWDKKWRIVLFDIPESQRTVRQLFRLKLMDLGVRMLQSSVWITPSPHAAEKFQELVAEHNFEDAVFVFESKQMGDRVIDVYNLWHLKDLEEEYKDLFAYFKKEVPKLEKSPNASYEAKCCIVMLSLLTKKDPYLPPELMPKDWIGYQAKDWYQKLRPFCQ